MSVPTALITGGTGAIGRAIARALTDAGFRVTCTGLTEAEVESCADDGIEARMLDVTDSDSVAGCVDAFEALQVLVNGAGITCRDGGEFAIDAFRQVLEVNLTGAMRMCVAARPLLAASGVGCIVNIASMLSYFGSPTVPAYSASKGGLVLLTRSLAAAWGGEGIRVNAIAPGYIETELTRALREDPRQRQRVLGRTPMGRWGLPEDIGPVVAFLCSPAARFITGAVLPVDGGYSAV